MTRIGFIYVLLVCVLLWGCMYGDGPRKSPEMVNFRGVCCAAVMSSVLLVSPAAADRDPDGPLSENPHLSGTVYVSHAAASTPQSSD